MNAVGQHPMKV